MGLSMRRFLFLFLLVVFGPLGQSTLAPALAQWCPQPSWDQLPVGYSDTYPPSSIYLNLPPPSPNPGPVSLSASASGAVQWIQIRWVSAKKALGETTDTKDSILPTPLWACGPSVSGQTRPLSWQDDGQHRLVAEAMVWWKVWKEYSFLGFTWGQWEVRSALISQRGMLPVYISWDQELGYDDLYKAFASRLWDIYKKFGKGEGAQGFSVDAFAKELASNDLRGTLQTMASGAYVDCGWFGICRRLAPVKMRWLSDVPSALVDMIRKGAICGGWITVCYEPQDSRLADTGPRIEVKSFLMIRTPFHDFIILDRVIPRRYYDPNWIYRYPGGDGRTAPKTPADSYDAVPEEERRRVMATCRAYKDTGEGRRCAAVIEVPGGVVQTLRQVMMVDFLFESSKEVQ